MASTIKNKHPFLKTLFIAFLFLSNISVKAQNEISNYKVAFGSGDNGNQKNIVIRKFEKKGKLFYVTVDPTELETKVVAGEKINFKPMSWSQILEVYKETPYIQAIQTAQKQSLAMQDSGITHGYPKEQGITLTIDLCPSHKPLDRVIFTSLISEFKKIKRPVPVGLSITGRFMLTHSEDLLWLEGLVKKGDLDITWINHTYNHHFDAKIPLKENFLLEPNTDINFEILGTEMALLQRGLVFSTFFRFPGLVSSQKLIDKVTDYGLIPIGSDAWLAKGQQVNSGSIVLIHGNGNEPLGVKDFINLLHAKDTAIVNKQWMLYDLRESVEEEFKN